MINWDALYKIFGREKPVQAVVALSIPPLITKKQLIRIMPYASRVNVDKYLEHINHSMRDYNIDTIKRIASFLAQIAHESGSLKYVKEIASGVDYEGRKDLGNTEKGDGIRYAGKGIIQITGRYNYQKVSNALGVDFIANPELLESPQYACESAAWYWKEHGCNQLADDNRFKDITFRINGGYNGLADREKYHKRALFVLS